MTGYEITKSKRVKCNRNRSGVTTNFRSWIVKVYCVHDARYHAKFRYKDYKLVSVRKVKI